MKKILRHLVLPLLLTPLLVFARTPAPPETQLYFISPAEGEQINGSVTVRFGLKGMGIAPAGMQKDGTGHHHLLIDTALPPLDQPVPVDARHVHFGAGQTETVITLPPGRHTLQLLLGDFAHIPHEPPVVSPQISITVQ